VADFFTDEWVELVVDAATELDAVDGISLVIQFEVTGGTDGKVHAVATIENGQLASFELGKQRGPDCTVAVTHDVAAQIFAGELHPRVAYMRGDIKLGGSYASVLFGMAPIYQAVGTGRFWQLVRTSTTFST